MPKRSSRNQDEDADDVNVTAFKTKQRIVDKTEGELLPGGDEPSDDADAGKNPAAVALGRLGGKKGGPARAKRLTADERSEIARIAALARWRKAKGKNSSD